MRRGEVMEKDDEAKLGGGDDMLVVYTIVRAFAVTSSVYSLQ